jgi:hypothetical protein
LPRAEPDVRREMRRSQLERIKREARQRLGREDPCAS